ncbi:MAG: 50S ribosomal protein L17 [Candidatus Omnitrophica bacterium]|nr:50S ribosomal protein L17 [Candidatus Omnitrophota bacterium]MCM8826881.1 50S ribosomal protein L17 [Candidatus Omnitrophota bacterium]
MRHRKKRYKLGRSRAQRKALIRSLVRSILVSERIKTTEAKAKVVRRWIDRLITWGKRNDLSSRRLAYKFIGEHKLVKRLFDELAPRFKDVSGGYTRIIDLGYRKGDGAKLSILELTRIEKKKKEKKEKIKSEELKKEKIGKEERIEKREVLPTTKEPLKKRFFSGIRKIFKRERGNP